MDYFSTLAVCPLVTSVAIVPSQLLAGHQASLYLTLISHPASFPPPLIKHARAGHPTLLINTWNTTRSEFLNVNVTYSFTVPAEGRVDIFLSALRAPEGSDCGSTLSGDYSSEYMLPIAGELVFDHTWSVRNCGGMYCMYVRCVW